ncbi:cache domain-containing protein [Swaminathania salitolerans]|uniref:Guanylate cyclase domain-containing protein n=1 Tax=Swaminathania salitolerans TaxID=182838 RepID=A0A511BS05_9PROT|nr:cache domain-containing protein [Swaminathania salitolerans]GBQ12636.1 two component hybrid sensor histidine kinase and regulator [Swaminathania salitolerans LMG 21291]GEL03117.1 hypothetical protein SSA02_22800 [Swaminathania salitolerans]
MPVSEIIDPADSDAGNRRRRFIEVVGPILGVILVVVVILVVALHSYHTTRKGVIALSQDLLREQQKHITQEVSDYLAPAPATATVARDLLTDPVTEEPPRIFLAYGASMLRNVSQVESFYLADDRGQFWFIDRAPRDIADGMEWVHLDRKKDVFRHWYYDKSGKLVRTTDTPAKHYDPRQRPWYEGAFDHPDLNWSDPYPTVATQQLIVTAASVLHTDDGHQAVFAINISLNRLTDFLAAMKIGRSGQAVVVDQKGRLVAGTHLLDVAKAANWSFDRMLLNPKTQPVFTRALALFHIYGSGVHLIKAHDTQYVTIMASLHHIRPGWILMLNAPENDFAAFTAAAGRQGLLFSLVIVVLAALLAGFLVRQSRRSERLQRRLDRQQAQTRAESNALNALAGTTNLLDPTHDAPLLTQRLAELAESRRVSLWRTVGNDERLLCEDAYDSDSDTHSAGMELSHDDLGAFFALLLEGDVIESHEAGTQEGLRTFQRIVMTQIDARSVYIQPIQARGSVIGMVVLEDARRPHAVSHVIAIVAEIAAIRFAALQGLENETAKPQNRHTDDRSAVETRMNEGFLAAPGESGSGAFAAGKYAMVSIATILFEDTAADSSVDLIPVVQTLVTKFQEVVRRDHIFSAQILGNRVVLIGECAQEPDIDAVRRVADALLALREIALITLSDAELTPSFRIGLDVGRAFGAVLGDDPGLFNVWGEAAQTSELLAVSAPDSGTIQVSETAYALLRDYYLFRPRGMFYLPVLGITNTYVLAARR